MSTRVFLKKEGFKGKALEDELARSNKYKSMILSYKIPGSKRRYKPR